MRPFVQYYDAIYSDKNYTADVEIFRGLVNGTRPTILEIGSGTGNQSLLMAEWANVTAVETDADFAAVMRKKCTSKKNITLFEGDIGDLSAKDFDGAAAFFNVVNYAPDKTALLHLFKETAQRLKTGAPFLFDMWHAECVLVDPPHETTRIKEFDNALGKGRATQTIYPTLNSEKRDVRLDYDVDVEIEGRTRVHLKEVIEMHLHLQSEVVEALRQAGFADIMFYDVKKYPEPANNESWTMWVTANHKGVSC